jgi:hypothetical protein
VANDQARVGIKITADAGQAKAEIDSTTESTNALGASASLNAENFAALKEMVASVGTEVADLTEILAADDASLETMQSALGRTTVAVANLREVIATLQEAGQPVPASVLVALDLAQTKVVALTEEFHGLAAAETEAGTAGAAAGEKVALGGVNIDRAATSSRGLKLALLGVTESMGGVIGVVAPWLLLLTLAPTVISQVATGVEKLTGFLASSRDKLADWVEGVQESIDVERKKGETDDQYSARLKIATDLQQKATEAQTAMNAGVLPLIDNIKLATVAWIAHEIALHPTPQLYALLAEASKAAGLKVVESFSDVQAKAEALNVTLQAILAVQGPAAATTWAEANRGAVKEIIQAYSDQGQKVPPEIQKVADALGIMSREQEKATKLQKELNAELQKASDQYVKSEPEIVKLALAVEDSEKAYVKATAAVEAHRRETNTAIEANTKTTVEGIDKQIESLDSLGLTQDEKNKKENDLLAEITKVRTDALNKEIENNKKAEDDQATLDRKEAERLIAFQERATKEGISLAVLGDAKDALKGKVTDLTDKIVEELKQHGYAAAAAVAAGDRLEKEATPKVVKLADAHTKVNDAMRAAPDAASAAGSAFDTLGTHVDGLAQKLVNLQHQIDAATGSAGGGGIPGLQGGAPLVGGEIGGGGDGGGTGGGGGGGF